MSRGRVSLAVAALISWGAIAGAEALEPPRMPYAFGMYCLMCHQAGVQIGPTQIFDMQTKTGNPLHEQYIRNNVRFGLKAMPAFRVSEIGPRELDDIVAYMKGVAVYRRTNAGYKPAPTQEGGEAR